MELLKALQGQAQQAEAFTVSSESTAVKFEANHIKSVEVEETSGVALRATIAGRLGFTAASGYVVESELVENVIESARYGDKISFDLPSPQSAPELETYDSQTASIPIDRCVAIGEEIIAKLLQIDDTAHIGVEITRSVSQVNLSNSLGVEISERATAFYVTIMVERVRGDDVFMVYDSAGSTSLNEDYRQATARVGHQMQLSKKSATLRSGRMPVLFSPSGAFVLTLPIMLGANGQHVQRGTSPLSDKLGQQIFDPQLTLWDDPTLPGLLRSSRYDDEGVPSRRKALLQKGILTQFITDLKTASLLGMESSGNGSRSLFALPSPSPTNLILEPGEISLETIIRSVDHGLLVEDVIGLGQGNAISGAFSNTVGLAYVIERGEIVGRVKDVSIAGNIYEDLKRIQALSRESYWVNGQIRMPYLLLPDLNVVCK